MPSNFELREEASKQAALKSAVIKKISDEILAALSDKSDLYMAVMYKYLHHRGLRMATIEQTINNAYRAGSK